MNRWGGGANFIKILILDLDNLSTNFYLSEDKTIKSIFGRAKPQNFRIVWNWKLEINFRFGQIANKFL